MLKATGNIGLDVASFTGLLDTFTATVGYSVRQLRADATSSLRVRRSSNDDEQDIGFNASNELDTTSLLAFVNADVDTYTSDFSSGTDSFSEHSTTNVGNTDGVSDGTTSKDDVLMVSMSGGNTSHQIRKANIFDGINTYDISFEYFIPSSNTKLDQIVFRTNVGGDGDTAFSTVGTWSTGNVSDFTPSGTQVRFSATDGGSFIFDSDDDVFFLKNIVITQTTANGAVTIWYDQSGNGNNATNSTDSEQPLVVSGGTLVTENSKAAIQFDGVDDTLQKDISPDISQPLTLFHIRRYRSNGTYVAVGYDNSTGNGYADINRSAKFQSYYGGGYTGAIIQNTDQGLFFSLANNLSSAVGLDGAALDTTNAQGTQGLEHLYIGSVFGAFNAPINTQELIIYASDQSANRTDIESNINNYFNIYTP